MKILLLSTNDRQGGAAIACYRLYKALRHCGADVRMLVMNKATGDAGVEGFNSNSWQKLRNFFTFMLERLYFLFFERSKKVRFSFSIANTGIDITDHPWVKESDIINLHWINQGFLSLNTIHKLAGPGKQVVWTLHDMWPFTGGCHYSGTCTHYLRECGNCPFLKAPSSHDLSNRVWHKKQKAYASLPLTVITPSAWLASCAKRSSLFGNLDVRVIPNPFDLYDLHPYDKAEARQQLGLPVSKKLILFGAAKVDDERKGYNYLMKALELLTQQGKKDIEIVVMGFVKEPELISFPVKTHFTGKLTGPREIATCYSAADLFVAPSLEDNLPNTIIEAFACGTPAVAFDTGGIPEIIEHRVNGYVAEYCNATDLAAGINWVLDASGENDLGQKARIKAERFYSQDIIGKKYLETFSELAKR